MFLDMVRDNRKNENKPGLSEHTDRNERTDYSRDGELDAQRDKANKGKSGKLGNSLGVQGYYWGGSGG